MRKLILITCIFVAFSANAAGSRGITTSDLGTPIVSSEIQISTGIYPVESRDVSYKTPSTFMTTLDSLSVRVVLPPGEYFAVYVDAEAETLGFEPQESPLDSALEWWVSNAPEFLQTQLRLNLADVDTLYAATYIPVLADADPLWLDELYFCLANLPPEVLEMPELAYLLPENVEYIYKFDSLLNYVEVVDLGTPGTPNHSTITRYFTKDTGMTSIDTVEIDAQTYYWHVMFPKISDELPLYIDPNTGDPVDPWSGAFWRKWFWDVSETGIVGADTFFCWPLGDSLMAQDVLWNGVCNTDIDNGAIGVITKWIKAVLQFTSDDERPHQPVRIYRKHMGRCGEHEDITNAAARMALIPCRNIEAISQDHVWNEFWTGWRWAGWEPVNTYIDNQWAYADGWGKQFATVFEHRGDGLFIPVTDRYSHEIATVDMTIYDSSDRPIDGAEIMIASAEGTSIFYDCIFHTNSRGKAVNYVGDAKHLYWRADAVIGSNPGPGYVDNLVTNTVDGITFTRTMNISASMPIHNWTAATPTSSPVAYLGARIAPVEEYIRRTGPFDDIETHYYLRNDDAYGFALFALDDTEFANFTSGGAFSALAMVERTDYGGIEVPVEAGGYWLVVSNKENVANILVGDLIVALHDSSTSIDETDLPTDFTLSAYPNPFNSSVRIFVNAPAIWNSLESGNPERAVVEIFDIAGRRIAVLSSEARSLSQNKGDFSPTSLNEIENVFTWQPSETVGSGIYFVRAKIHNNTILKKNIVYLK
ncbi:T9SS type A sorting domain-containing protein [bacterium]|nr:T9SS type A sorting domain-containing protein [bacterium]